MHRPLQQSHDFQISRFQRKRIPLGPWLGLEHLLQGAMKLGDRGPRIRRPGREPLLQLTEPRAMTLTSLSLIQAPPPPDVSRHAEDRAITVPGARRVAPLLPPAPLQEDQHTPGARPRHVGRRISGQVRARRIVRPPAETVRSPGGSPRPTPATSDPPSTRRPSERTIHRRGRSGHGVSILVRSPKKCEGILIVGNAESAERRDIERVADVRQPVQAVQPPDGKSPGGDRKADRQHEHDPHSWRSLLRSN